ncbi:GSCOCG00006954001-RA-CDS [Cotesia congregata]|uniref:Uncharacterized protein n=1 Tax=Cotesia congregata TaxID=51543 RepID=A0A8J2MS55_COTCN|nr:GSCOCG00006954001-RA-CDS [Cotesia congregata]CAG5092643.1 Protein of unknown function [Cotesia congregata]
MRDSLCPVYDAEYMTEPDTYVDDNNGLFFNFSIIKTVPSTIEGYLAIIGASMGEYVVDIGINLIMPFCEMLDEPLFMSPLLQMFGFNKDNCPPKPGVYGSESYTVPTSMFPENFPPNQYKIAFEIMNEGKQILVIDVYFDIQ